jgi:hypothetical protein
MCRNGRTAKCLLIIAAVSASAGRANAFDWFDLPEDGILGDLIGLFHKGYDAPSSYSPMHYWAPTVSQINDCVHGPRLNVYAPDRHPEIAPGHDILTFPTAVAAPADTIVTPPNPPATSTAR